MTKRIKLETLKDVTDAVEAGHVVKWKSTGYEVRRNGNAGGYVVVYVPNGDCVGLHVPDYFPGGRSSDFFRVVATSDRLEEFDSGAEPERVSAVDFHQGSKESYAFTHTAKESGSYVVYSYRVGCVGSHSTLRAARQCARKHNKKEAEIERARLAGI